MTPLEFLDGAAVRLWCGVAAEALGGAKEQIDALNVFPVADRDTGTNLHQTMLSAVRALDGLPDSAASGEVWQALAQGVLFGAQGNSGVIVSQFLRGLAEICGPASPCDGGTVGRGLTHAARLSRAAVGEPVEGTVLTVASAGAASAAMAGSGLAAVARAAAQGARLALAETTVQLDVLARNGVVDAGAAGLCLLLDTLAGVVTGTFPEPFTVRVPVRAPVTASGTAPRTSPASVAAAPHRPPTAGAAGGDDPAPAAGGAGYPAGRAGYEVMYLLEATGDAVARLRDRLLRIGDSLVVVGGEGTWNVHVHVTDAGAAIEAGMTAGRPHRIRVTYLGVPEPSREASGGFGSLAAGGEALAWPGGAAVARDPVPGSGDAGEAAGGEALAWPGGAAVACDPVPGSGDAGEAAGGDAGQAAGGDGARVTGSVAPDGAGRAAGGAGAIDAAGAAARRRAVVVVAAGEGIADLCERAGAVVVRRGGGRVPPLAELIDVVGQAADPGGEVIILADDRRASRRCAAVATALREMGITVCVAPSQTAVQCLSALAVHDPARGFDDDAAAMAQAADATRWGRVTWPPATADGHGREAAEEVRPAEAVGVVGDDVVVTAADAGAVAVAVVDRLLAAGGEIVTLVAGSSEDHDAPAGRDIAATVAAYLDGSRPDLEVTTYDGGDGGYLLLVGVE